MINIVILAAGKGSRLGRDLPKPLTELNDGRTIMQQQIDNIYEVFDKEEVKLHIVVGYQAEIIVESQPQANFVYNENYDVTNTSKSLLRAIKALNHKNGLLWLNGDVVFNHKILHKAKSYLNREQSFVAVDTSSTSDEEVKYTVNKEGYINLISKTVPQKFALGEAVGINYFSPQDISFFEKMLHTVEDNDYFERGIELAIQNHNLLIEPLDISSQGWYAVEIDFEADLERANLSLS